MRDSIVRSALLAAALVTAPAALQAQEPAPERPSAPTRRPVLGFVGLHGGFWELLEPAAEPLGVEVRYVSDAEGTGDRGSDVLAALDFLFIQHLQAADADRWTENVLAARRRNPGLRVFTLSGNGDKVPRLASLIEVDPALQGYYGASARNLRSLLVYVVTKVLRREGPALEPPEEVRRRGLYHPGHEGFFETAEELLTWARAQRPALADAPRVAIVTHPGRFLTDHAAEAALVEALERRGLLAFGVMDGRDDVALLKTLQPRVCIHTCHSGDPAPFREELGALHMHVLFTRHTSIADFEAGANSVTASDTTFQVTSQEVNGAIEPLFLSATRRGGSSAEMLTPIPERVERIADRAAAWVRLGQLPRAQRRVAFIYYNKSMGKGDLMRGSSSGMYMNAPRSMVRVLERLRREGYGLDWVPADEDELLDRLMRSGRNVGQWAPAELDRLVATGEVALVPADTYARWLERRVPERRRQELIARWGPSPGTVNVWRRDDGKQFIVIPSVRLGNVVLLPQPTRQPTGDDDDGTTVHDRHVPPPHHYLATYFWIEEGFGAHAMVHFGTHGSEFFLPGRPVGMGPDDWCDMIVGRLPNLHPWILNNLSEAVARRRTLSVLIDHLPAPSVTAGVPDELQNLHTDIDKWALLATQGGALAEGFRRRITEQVRATKLQQDLGLELGQERLLTDQEIERVAKYLHDIAEEPLNVELHVFGEPPSRSGRLPYVVRCLGKRFAEAVAALIPCEDELPGHDQARARRLAEEVVGQVLRGASAEDALRAAGATGDIPEEVTRGLTTAQRIDQGLEGATNEMDALIRGLDGRFVSPGPAGAPDRNPGSVPTGKNMYTINPEEVPSRPSWELGKQLVESMLADQLKRRGRYPTKVAFSLNASNTFLDYGVLESQVLYLMGVRPVWDERNLVQDVELIPRADLGRPRIDVFLAPVSAYRDLLESRMRLIDKAVRLVAAVEEEDNGVRLGVQRVEEELRRAGVDPARAAVLARGRIFSRPPGEYGGPAVGRIEMGSGDWDTRDELARRYIDEASYVYTEAAWGEEARQAYERTIQGTEVVLRSWADSMRTPLGDAYKWSQGGALSLAVRHLTGKEPEYLLADVRDPDDPSMIAVEDAVQRDFRVRLLNRRWIEGMMKEGYAGADQVTATVTNVMGWAVTREGSISNEDWQTVYETFVQDRLELNVREWFEAENPWAFQKTAELLIEAVRKEYWRADRSMTLELAREYARSIARHGTDAGGPGANNAKLEAFVRAALVEQGATELLETYEARLEEIKTSPAPGAAPGPMVASAAVSGPAQPQPESATADPPPSAAPGSAPPAEPVEVEGTVLTPSQGGAVMGPRVGWLVGLGCVLLVLVGVFRGDGAAGRESEAPTERRAA